MKVLLLLLLCLYVNFCFTQDVNKFYSNALRYKEKKDYPNALKQIEKALCSDSLNISYLSEKAIYMEELKNYQEAYDMLSKAISIAPGESFLYSYRGHLLLTIQEFDYSIQDYSKAIEFAKNDSIKSFELVNRSAAKIYKRDFNSAYDDLKKAYEFDSTDIGTLTNLASICDEIGKGDETLKYLLRAIEIKPDFYPAYGNIGFKYQEMGNYKKAIEYYNKVLEFKPDEPLGYSNRSFNKYKLGDLKGAYKDIEKSILLYPSNSYAYRIRALICIQDGKITNACKDLQTALELGFTKTFGDEVQSLQKKYCKN